MFILRSTHQRILRASLQIQRETAEREGIRERTANAEAVSSAQDQAKQWRKAALERRGKVSELEGRLQAALERATSAEAAYRGLVEKMLAPPKAPAPLEPVDPEIASLDRISDETVVRMAEQLVRDGLAPDVAQREARELVTRAERAWGGVGDSV